MLQKYSDVISGVFLILVSVIVGFASQDIKRMAGVSIGSDFFPKIAAAMLFGFGVIILVTASYGKRSTAGGDAAQKSDKDTVIVQTDWKAPVISMGLLIVYVALLETVGFAIMTFLYLFAQITLLAPKHKRKYLVFLAIALGVTVFIHLIFVVGLSVMLPGGFLA